MYPRSLAIPSNGRQSFFLFGPRGTGKTTWLKQRFPDAIYLDLLDHALYLELLARPQRLRDLIPPGYDGWVVVDEVQRTPLVLNEVHRLIEADGLRFILTGSSARSLRRRGVNLLGGRARTHHLYPLTAVEAGADFALERALIHGQLPSVYTQPDPDAYLASYVENYLRQEVLEEGRTRNLATFSRFLESASFSQAAPLNVAEVARDVGVDRKTASAYFDLLEDLLIATRVPVFTKRAKRRMTTHHEVLPVRRRRLPGDPAHRSAGQSGANRRPRSWRRWSSRNYAPPSPTGPLKLDLFFWRTASGTEVDFVAYGGDGLFAIEVKRTRTIRRADLHGLKQFRSDYPMARCVLLFGGDRREHRDGIELLPLAEALANPTLMLDRA